ncbi:MAG: SDR family NAD(P)-dependent oxidoreductase [Chroococcidiopsidaceae cyanobacterium CP_BM_ER_R8_30]|nr:SDR family NAD(P)-dependent oxidoreductase [Chroococcidiopsidaceae cyanobacterium CP_BM_ER_R8_30]
MNALGAFLASKQVIPAMKQNGRGNIIFIGATASRRGEARTAAFAPAKAAQKSLAESMARHLWPLGVHASSLAIGCACGAGSHRCGCGYTSNTQDDAR